MTRPGADSSAGSVAATWSRSSAPDSWSGRTGRLRDLVDDARMAALREYSGAPARQLRVISRYKYASPERGIDVWRLSFASPGRRYVEADQSKDLSPRTGRRGRGRAASFVDPRSAGAGSGDGEPHAPSDRDVHALRLPHDAVLSGEVARATVERGFRRQDARPARALRIEAAPAARHSLDERVDRRSVAGAGQRHARVGLR